MAAHRRFMTHVTCRLTAKNRDQLRNPTLGNRVWAASYPYLMFQLSAPPGSVKQTNGNVEVACLRSTAEL